MKPTTLPDYPIMYKATFAAGDSEQCKFRDFLFFYVCEGEGRFTVGKADHLLKKGTGWVVSRGERITFHADTEIRTFSIRISEEAVTDYLLHIPLPSPERGGGLGRYGCPMPDQPSASARAGVGSRGGSRP